MMKSILPILLLLFCAYQSAIAINCPPVPGATNGTASVTGDPHVKTWDSFTFETSATGTFFLVRTVDSSLNVEAQFTACNGARSCATAVAVQFNGATAVYQSGTITLTNAAGKITTATDSHGAQFIILSDGFTVSIQSINNGVNLFAPASYFDRVNGLLGNFDGNPNNDLTDANGKTVDMAGFLAAWTVPSGQDLFANPAASIPPLTPGFTCPGTNNITPCKSALVESVTHTAGIVKICFEFKTQVISTLCAAGNYNAPANCTTCF